MATCVSAGHSGCASLDFQWRRTCDSRGALATIASLWLLIGRLGVGHIISASCQCGYSVPAISIGGSRANFLTCCLHPALCEECKQIVVVNLKAEEISCPNGCLEQPRTYFNSTKLQRVPGIGCVSDWAGHALNTGNYLCPSCNRYSLRFSPPHIEFD